MKAVVGFCLLMPLAASPGAAELSVAERGFVERYCYECHDRDTMKGGLDLTALKLDLANPTNFSTWVLVHDRVSHGEMPPKKEARPEEAALTTFTQALFDRLMSAERASMA